MSRMVTPAHVSTALHSVDLSQEADRPHFLEEDSETEVRGVTMLDLELSTPR